MTDQAVWHLFAFFHDDKNSERDEHRNISEWQIEDVTRWARHRGYDVIMLTRTAETARFEKHPSPEGIRHSG